MNIIYELHYEVFFLDFYKHYEYHYKFHYDHYLRFGYNRTDFDFLLDHKNQNRCKHSCGKESDFKWRI